MADGEGKESRATFQFPEWMLWAGRRKVIMRLVEPIDPTNASYTQYAYQRGDGLWVVEESSWQSDFTRQEIESGNCFIMHSPADYGVEVPNDV